MQITAYLSLVLATLAWGGNTVAGKLALGHVSPMMLTTIRWAIASILIFLAAMPQIRRDWPLARRHLPLLFFFGAAGFTLFNAMLYSALRYTSAINVAIEQAGIPMTIFALNFILFRTRVFLGQAAGFVLTLSGVALTAAHGDLERLLSLTLNRGDALMLVAVAAYSLYTIALRYKPPVDWRTLMAFSALGAFVAALPLLLVEVAQSSAILPDAFGFAIVLYTAVFASLMAQVLFVKGVEAIGANRAGLFINLVPVFGTLLSVLVLGERLEAFHILALGLVLGGIAVAERGRR